MRRALFAGVALLVLIVAVVLIRTFNFTPEAPSTVELVTHEPDPDVLHAFASLVDAGEIQLQR